MFNLHSSAGFYPQCQNGNLSISASFQEAERRCREPNLVCLGWGIPKVLLWETNACPVHSEKVHVVLKSPAPRAPHFRSFVPNVLPQTSLNVSIELGVNKLTSMLLVELLTAHTFKTAVWSLGYSHRHSFHHRWWTWTWGSGHPAKMWCLPSARVLSQCLNLQICTHQCEQMRVTEVLKKLWNLGDVLKTVFAFSCYMHVNCATFSLCATGSLNTAFSQLCTSVKYSKIISICILCCSCVY